MATQATDTRSLEEKLAALAATRKGAWLKPLLPLIDGLIRAGVPRAAVVDLLNAEGHPMSLSQLEKALYRWRRDQARPSLNALSESPQPEDRPPAAHVGQPSYGYAVHNKGDLVQLRNAEPPNLHALARLARNHQKESKK